MHPKQSQIKQTAKRRNVICCGRRFGKNILLQDLAATCGVGAHVGWGAPIYKQTLDDFRALDNMLSPIVERRSASEMRLELLGGGAIEFWSMDKPDSIRGKKYHRFIINEAGFVPNLLDIRNYIIMPTLIDYQGDEWYAGTPKGMNGFFSLYNMSGDDWAHWQMPSYSNPHIPAKELDALKDIMTERAFQQEILAQFLEDGGGVFRKVREVSTLSPCQPTAMHSYVIGVDWGRSNDATVFCVMDAETKCQVYLDRMTDTDYASQRLRLAALVERYNRALVIAESNSMGQPNIEALYQMGVNVTPFNTSNASKSAIIQALELAFERGDIGLLSDELQINELMAYQSEKLPSGMIRYGAPDGLHDDTVMALAIAYSSISMGAVTYASNPFSDYRG